MASSRRAFLKASVAACALNSSLMNARVVNQPIGLQLYTVGKEMDADAFGTLKQVAAVGYKTIFTASLNPTKTLRDE